MARGREGAFGGKTLLKPYVWLAFCVVFLLGLADLRRPLSMRNLDLLVLLGFTVSLVFFDRGEIFRSVPLAYPALAYVLGRGLWVGFGRRGKPLGVGLADLGARRGRGLPARIPGRAQPGDAARRHRRRSCRRRGSDQDPRRRGAVREHAATRRPRSRAARRTPKVRCGSASRRTAAARRRSSAATRTARSRTSRTCPRPPSSTGAGSGTRSRPHMPRRSHST